MSPAAATAGTMSPQAPPETDSDGVLADELVRQLVRDATAARSAPCVPAACRTRSWTARGLPHDATATSCPKRPGGPAPLQPPEVTNACPITGSLGEGGEARMKIVQGNSCTVPTLMYVQVYTIVVFLRFYHEYYGDPVAGMWTTIGPLCVVLLRMHCDAIRRRSNFSDKDLFWPLCLSWAVALVAYCITIVQTYMSCETDPTKLVCSMTEFGSKTNVLSPIMGLYTITFFLNGQTVELKAHFCWRDRLLISMASHTIVFFSHIFFVDEEGRWIVLKMLAFGAFSSFLQLYLFERQLRVLFLIETDLEYDKQRHFFSMQAKVGETVKRMQDLAWYLKTMPFELKTLRAGASQIQLDNRMTTKACHAIKQQLLAENGQLVQLNNSPCNACPFQGWGLTAEQNGLLDMLYTQQPCDLKVNLNLQEILLPLLESEPRAEEENHVNLNLQEKSLPLAAISLGIAHGRFSSLVRIFHKAIICFSPIATCGSIVFRAMLPRQLSAFTESEQSSRHLFSSMQPQFVVIVIVLFFSLVFTVREFKVVVIMPSQVILVAMAIMAILTRSGIYFRGADMTPVVRRMGTFMLLASSFVPVLPMTFLQKWTIQKSNDFYLDHQYAIVFVLFFNIHSHSRAYLQTKHCGISWRSATVYNFVIWAVNWFVFSSKIWGHNCFPQIQASGLVLFVWVFMARYDHEVIMRKCFLAERSNKQVQADAFYTVMHDINQPLNVITNCCDLLTETTSSSEAADVFLLLTVSVSWQSQLIDSLSNEQLLGNALFEPSYCDGVNIQQLLTECLTIGKGYYFGGGLPVKLICEISAEVPVCADHFEPVWVKRFILNLVSNAIKFTLEGTITISVKRVSVLQSQPSCQSATREDALCFSVADTGFGIPEDKANRLFCKFSQLHDENRGGTGLGLWSMKQMLQAMNGQCGYTKNLPAGSVFWFQVPCSSWNMKAAALLDDEALPMIRSAPSVLKPLDSSILSPLVANSAARQCGSEGALLVDDDRLAYFVLARMLRRSGVDLQGRFDGAAGLSLLTSGCFSCVFMDLMMPKMGGGEAISRFRRWESIHRVGQRRQPICILSGSENFKHKYKSMGADFALTKPCEAKQMKYIIDQACGINETVRAIDETDCEPVMSIDPSDFTGSELQATPVVQQHEPHVIRRPTSKRKIGPATAALVVNGGVRTRAKILKIS